MTGIYTITHRESGRVYVGSSADTDYRFYQHRWYLNRGEHTNRRLQRAWKKYGSDAFEWVVVEECETDKLIEREQWHLDQRQPCVYNIGIQVDAVTRGMPVPKSVRQKLSASHKARGGFTPEHRAALAAANKRRAGWKHTEAAKQAVSEANTGRVRTSEHCAAISRAQKGNQHAKGRKMDPAIVARVALKNTGRKQSPEACERKSVARLAYLERQKQAVIIHA